MKLKRVLILLLAVCLIFQVPSALTFGDFDSDSDGGGSDSGSDWDSDWGSDGSSSRRGSGSSGPSGWIIVLVLIIIFIRFVLVTGLNGTTSSGQHSSTGSNRSHTTPGRSSGRRLEDMQTFYEKHPGAKAYDLKPFVRKLFTDMQEGWEAGNIENVRRRFVPDTWSRFANQLAAKNARGEITHVRHILLERIELKGWYVMNGGEDEVTVTFDAYSNIWTTNRSGKLISGTESRRLRQSFEWTLVWSEEAEEKEIKCPNCGNPVDASSFAACPYCGTELKRKGGWLLKQIDAVSQTTIHG